MKNWLIFLFLISFIFSGCSVLDSKDPLGLEDREDKAKETEPYASDSDEDDDEDEDYEDDDDDEDEDDEDDDEEDDEDDEDEKKGFFSSLFSSDEDTTDEGDDEDEDEDEEDDFEDEDEEDDFEDDEDEDDEDDDEEDDEDEEDDDDEKKGFFANLFSSDEDTTDEGDDDFAEDEDEDILRKPVPVTSYDEEDDFIKSAAAYPKLKSLVSVKKIKEAPYYRSGYLVNSVYIVRPNETMSSISKKLFGRNMVNSLYEINPHFKSKSVKVGDKIYYSSIRRPKDNSRLLTFYEDQGMVASYYLISAGQNLRKISQALLGHKDSWKEIWSTNMDLESKTQVNQSIQIRYWKEGAQVQEPEMMDDEETIQAPEESPQEPEMMDDTPEEIPVQEAPVDSDPDFLYKKQSKIEQWIQMGIHLVKTQKMFAIGLLVFLALLILILKKIVSKIRRKKEEFDYTNPGI